MKCESHDELVAAVKLNGERMGDIQDDIREVKSYLLENGLVQWKSEIEGSLKTMWFGLRVVALILVVVGAPQIVKGLSWLAGQ